jgi:hypothetical protein
METDPVSETLCSLEYRTMDKSKHQVIRVIHRRQKPSDSDYKHQSGYALFSK